MANLHIMLKELPQGQMENEFWRKRRGAICKYGPGNKKERRVKQVLTIWRSGSVKVSWKIKMKENDKTVKMEESLI